VEKEKFWTPKDAATQIGVEAELLKTWSNEFNIQTKRTNGGHRRYSKENIEELLAIKKKLHEENASYDEIRSWRNGEVVEFKNKEEKSELEKKMDKILAQNEQLLEDNRLQREFNRALVEQLDATTKRMEKIETASRDRDTEVVQTLRLALETKREAALAEEESKSKQKRNPNSIWDKIAFWKQ